MANQVITVLAAWDEEAGVWYATTEEISGLAVEHETLDGLLRKVTDAVSDLCAFSQVWVYDIEVKVRLVVEAVIHGGADGSYTADTAHGDGTI